MAEFGLGFLNAWLMSVPFLALVACMVGRNGDVIKRMSDMTGYSGREKFVTLSASLSPYPFTLAAIWAPFTSSRLLLFVGLLVYALGMAMLAASLKAIIGTPIDKPFATGPYLFSRNPMYVGATAVLLGICLATTNLALFVYVAVATLLQHFMILAEERICKSSSERRITVTQRECHGTYWSYSTDKAPNNRLNADAPHRLAARYLRASYMKRIILSVLLFMNLMPIYAHGEDLMAIVSPEPKNYAWWLRITFTPTHKEMYGIPIKKLDPTWAFASQLKKEAIPHDVLFEKGQDTMARAGIDFIQSGDFNNDKIEDLSLVGVFQDIEHHQGRFFLILTRKKDGSWEKAFLRTWFGKPGFLGLQGNGQPLVLWFCMECGGLSDITWDEKLKKYEIQKSADEDL